MGSKAARKVPDILLKWLADNVSPEFAQWYAKNSRAGARQITAERQRMSAEAGTVGAYHEGHFRGAKDVDPVMGGGPTTGLTMRPEIGAVNTAHAEAPRIPYEDMRRAGIPQNWIEDVFETILKSEGLGVIGNYDTQAAMDMDYGDATPGQAMAQTDRRIQLREQNVKQVGPDTSVQFKPFEGEIKFNPDAELPNLTEGLQRQLELEQRQIALRRSTRISNGTIRLNSMDPITMISDPLRRNPTGSFAGAFLDAYNLDTVKKLESGDYMGAGEDVLKGAVIGATIEAGAKVLGPTVASTVGKVVAPLAGAQFFLEGRPGSTTDYLAKNYGSKVGMNQDKPSWGLGGEAMDPDNPTMQKPAMVKNVEDFIDVTAGKINMAWKKFTTPDPEQPKEDLNFTTL